MGFDRARAERAMAEFLEALGLPPESKAELSQTPERVAEAFHSELLVGYGSDVTALLQEPLELEVAGAATQRAPTEAPATKASPARNKAPGEWVVLTSLSVTTMCPHHLMPALGKATVAYLPGARLLGLGRVAAALDALSRRFTLQEQLGQDMATALVQAGDARAAYCELELLHTCLSARHPGKEQARVRTVSTAGEFTEARQRALLLSLGGQR